MNRFFTPPPESEKPVQRLARLVKRQQELNTAIANYGLHGDLEMLLRTFDDYRRFGVYPFGRGVWEDQPSWLLEDFETLALVKEATELQDEIRKLQNNG